MSRVVLQKRVLDVLAREVAIQAATVARVARELEDLHKALLQVGASATPERMTTDVGQRPHAVPEVADVEANGPESEAD